MQRRSSSPGRTCSARAQRPARSARQRRADADREYIKRPRCTKYAKTTAPDADGKVGFEVADYKSSEFGLLANLFACDGKPGDVIEVRVKVRKGTDNFVSCMRKGLAQALEEADNDAKQEGMPIRRCIGMGGVFKVAKGQVRAHVMPPFKKTLMEDGPEVEDWLKFFPMGPDLLVSPYS